MTVRFVPGVMSVPGAGAPMNAICANAEPTRAAAAKSDFMYILKVLMTNRGVEKT